MSVFGTWLLGAMNAQGMDARRLALALNVSEGSVHGWLYKGAIPSVRNLAELARLTGVGVETIIELALGFSVAPSPSPAEREQRRAAILARLPRFAEIAEKVAVLPAEQQDAYLSIIERMLPGGLP